MGEQRARCCFGGQNGGQETNQPMKYSRPRALYLIARDTGRNAVNSLRFRGANRVCYHVETVDWSIEDDGMYVTEHLSSKIGHPAGISYSPFGVVGQTLHFGDVYLVDRLPDRLFKIVSKTNNLVVTFYHLEPDDDRLKMLRDRIDQIDFVHTSCTITRDALVENGIPDSMIRIVPIGVDTELFRPLPKSEVSPLRERLDIPEGVTLVGSFQKDSHGWGDSTKPKLVKGPDVLVEVARHLNRDEDVYFLLLGPSRGYVKSKFDEYGIPYTHLYIQDYAEVPKYYNLLDLYLITSRSEGGPKAIPEGLATGTPLVTTRVGMAPDILTTGHDGYVVDVENTSALVTRARELIRHPDRRQQFSENGLETAKSLSWPEITEELYEKIYKRE